MDIHAALGGRIEGYWSDLGGWKGDGSSLFIWSGWGRTLDFLSLFSYAEELPINPFSC